MGCNAEPGTVQWCTTQETLFPSRVSQSRNHVRRIITSTVIAKSSMY